MTRTLLRLATAAILAAGMLAVPAAASAADAVDETVAIGTTASVTNPVDQAVAIGTTASTVTAWTEGRFKLVLKPESGPAVTATLRCRPHGGSHPRVDAACADLDAASGRIGDIPSESGACTKEFAPVAVFAVGVWDGGPRSYKHHYSNRCEAVKQTGGAVFGFS